MRTAADAADLIVLNRELHAGYPDMLEVVSDGAKAGKPIVAVPESGTGFEVSGHALVAWDGSPEAVNALHASVPLLARASSVTILAIDDGSLNRPLTYALTYLLARNIRATAIQEDALIERPGSIILEHIEKLKAGYLVMGGFGHGRFLEAAFGGVTRKMLKECPIPIVLDH